MQNIETKEITNSFNMPFGSGFLPDMEYKAEIHITNDHGEKQLYDIQNHQLYLLNKDDEMDWVDADENSKKLIENHIQTELKNILYDW